MHLDVEIPAFLPWQGGRSDGPSGAAGEAGGGGAGQEPADVPAETPGSERSRKGSSFPDVEEKSEWMFRARQREISHSKGSHCSSVPSETAFEI